MNDNEQLAKDQQELADKIKAARETSERIDYDSPEVKRLFEGLE